MRRTRNSDQCTYDAANAVLLAEGVEQVEELDGLGDGLLGGDDLDGDTLVEVDGDVVGSIGGLHGAEGASPVLFLALVRPQRVVDRHIPHVIGRSGVGVLEDTGLWRSATLLAEQPGKTNLVGAVGDVVIGRVGLGLGLGNGNAWDG